MASPVGTRALPVERMERLLEGSLHEPWGPAASGCPLVSVDPDPVFYGALLGASAWEHGPRQISHQIRPPKRPQWLTPEPVEDQTKEEDVDAPQDVTQTSE